MLGRLYGVSNESEESEKAFDQALKADPDNEDAQTLSAMLYADHGELQKAIGKLKAASDKKPNERTLAALADVYERTNDFKSAADALRRARHCAEDDHLAIGPAFDLLRSNQFDDAWPSTRGSSTKIRATSRTSFGSPDLPRQARSGQGPRGPEQGQAARREQRGRGRGRRHLA